MIKPHVLLTTALIVGSAAFSTPAAAATATLNSVESAPQLSLTVTDSDGLIAGGRHYRYCRGYRSRRGCAFHRFYHRRCKYRFGLRQCKRIFSRRFDRYDDGFDPYSSRYDDRFDRIADKLLDRVFDQRHEYDKGDYYRGRRYEYDDD